MRVSSLLCIALVSASLIGAAGVVHGAEPELKILVDRTVRYEPGPGWPGGWTPPPKPTELTPDAKESWERLQALPVKNKPERLEMRVLDVMPAWTREHPYIWTHSKISCGSIMYEFYYPYPDRDLLWKMTGKSYTAFAGPFDGSTCEAGGVYVIAGYQERSMEEIEAERALWRRLYADAAWAKGGYEEDGGLPDCMVDTDGQAENIPVCFNHGSASARFDVSAYLDSTVGRVRVPVRFVSEMMGAQVTWEQETWTATIDFPAMTREVMQPIPKPGLKPIDLWYPNEHSLNSENFTLEVRTVTQPQRRIQLTVGRTTALVDGTEVPIDAPPVIKNERMMIPIRFVAQTMGAKVYWVGEQPIWRSGVTRKGTRQVHIFSRFSPYFESPSWFLETRAMGY
jgi:hypothetical protein